MSADLEKMETSLEEGRDKPDLEELALVTFSLTSHTHLHKKGKGLVNSIYKAVCHRNATSGML